MLLCTLEFMFSKKATKIEKVFTVDLTLTLVNVKLTVKIWSIFVAYLENIKFTGSTFEQNRVLFNPTSADLSEASLKSILICSNEDRTQQCFKIKWVLEKYLFDFTFTGLQASCQKGTKSNFQSKSESFCFYFSFKIVSQFWKKICYWHFVIKSIFETHCFLKWHIWMSVKVE